MYKCAQYVQSVHVEFIRSQRKQSVNVRYVSVQDAYDWSQEV